MKTLSEEELKSRFSEVIEDVKSEEKLAGDPCENKPDRTLGILQGKAEIIFKDDFEMTTEEFLKQP